MSEPHPGAIEQALDRLDNWLSNAVVNDYHARLALLDKAILTDARRELAALRALECRGDAPGDGWRFGWYREAGNEIDASRG